MSSEGGGVERLERALDLVHQRALGVDEVSGELARALQQPAVPAQVREAEVAEPGLARPEQLPAATDVEVDLGELEAVRRADERLQPGNGRLGQLLLGARDQQAVGLLRAAADATSK